MIITNTYFIQFDFIYSPLYNANNTLNQLKIQAFKLIIINII